MEKVSVIIPTFNRAAMLPCAVQSVFSQTMAADEIIVIDDGSTDGTAKVVEGLSDLSPVTLVYLYQENRGPAAARNSGVQKAGNTLVAFLDSDDHWHKEKLKIQMSAMNSAPHRAISHTREKWYRRGRHLNQKRRHEPPDGSIFERCLELCCVGMSTVMLRKTVFQKYGYFNEALRCCEDYDYWLRLSVHEEFMLIDNQLTIKEGGRSDQVSSMFRMGMDRFRIWSICNLLRSEELSEERQKAACRVLLKKCLVYGNGCIKHGKKEEGEAYLRLAEEMCPSFR